MYGYLAEAMGREVEVAVEGDVTVGDIRHVLFDRFPKAVASLGRSEVMGCIDDQITGDGEIVPKGKALAFLPILSGG